MRDLATLESVESICLQRGLKHDGTDGTSYTDGTTITGADETTSTDGTAVLEVD